MQSVNCFFLKAAPRLSWAKQTNVIEKQYKPREQKLFGTNVEDIFRLSRACSTDLLQQPLNLWGIHLVAYQQAVCAWSQSQE